ncbi:DUF502 domain-containing protein [endosymbiont of Ridgeia piscesae]|jgi:uncharacterized membrane protein|uniref:Putative membrane protein n=1 Tax=endosymbiont of Ridgeia piscesae TaxID=54398 RepID=A0A0T5YZ33_9GAMM|nr:DUF502 domain-containing protein [endosymbiont of Ridgeia piscesae]KRT55803.1 putative membrane protein [endosymbiont of Ridgeia piscesae]KRT56877.1 putative membrane protein [endosymbiont of Ridgeia piscesae]
MLLLRRYLVAGLLVWLPLVAVYLVVRTLVRWMDSSLLLLPLQYRPETLLGTTIPGLGVLLSLLILLFTGLVAANLFGRKLVRLWERLLARIPLVRSVYSAVKQLVETMFSDNGDSFRKVVLVEFPRRGLWTLGFLTSSDVGEAQQKIGCEVLNVYIPTTPNPTGGYFVMVPKEEVQELEMSVDDGLKMLLSMGAIVPPPAKPEDELAQAEAKP